jgi:hypothetical protein
MPLSTRVLGQFHSSLDSENGIPVPETEPDPKPEPKPRSYPSREGKIPVQFFLNKDAHRQLKITSAETDKTNQDIMREALNAWFQMNDKPPIA